jgi:hypothetical protein
MKIKFLFKWLFRLFLLCVVLLVVFFLSLDTILRLVMEHNIREQTGMEVNIGKFHLGLLEPVVEIKNFRLNNPASFGGTPFLNIPEIHVEYDKPALKRGQIHITLLRFNLGELNIVKNEAGKTNLFELGVTLPTTNSLGRSKALEEFKRRTGLDFKQIDELRVWVGTAKYIDLKEAKNNREQKIGIENLLMKNLKEPADITGLVLLIALRSGDFFGSLVAPSVGLK